MIDISTGWRQVRIFTSDFSHNWYFGLLRKFCIPLAEQNPDTYFWFSRYYCSLDQDKDDCDYTKIPNTFVKDGNLASLRIRFRGLDESFFGEPSEIFWWSDIRDFDALSGLGGAGDKRFYSGDDDGVKRASLVSHVFCANSRLVLDSFGDNGFEINNNPQNQFNRSYFLSMHHMANNIYGIGVNGNSINLYATDRPIQPNTPFNWVRL